MKRVLYSLFVFCSLCLLWGCDETSQDTSKITYFVNFEMNGDEVMKVPVGATFTDPGVVAMEGENDITSSVEVQSNVDASKIGVYAITYTAKNVDGFASSTERKVVIYDPAITVDASGTYTIDPEVSYRLYNNAQVAFKSAFKVQVDQVAPGVFYMSDFLGGWYDQGSAYGSTYAMTGYFKLNADNSIEVLSSFLAGWGDSLNSMTDGKYDPAAGQLSWTVDYSTGMKFYEVLNK